MTDEETPQLGSVVNKSKQDIRSTVEEEVASLLTKIDDLENHLPRLAQPIKELTPSDDIEIVKQRLNQVISAINQLVL